MKRGLAAGLLVAVLTGCSTSGVLHIPEIVNPVSHTHSHERMVFTVTGRGPATIDYGGSRIYVTHVTLPWRGTLRYRTSTQTWVLEAKHRKPGLMIMVISTQGYGYHNGDEASASTAKPGHWIRAEWQAW